MSLRFLLCLCLGVFVLRAYADDPQRCSGLKVFHSYEGSISDRQSGSYEPIPSGSCSWLINPPAVDAVPHRVELHFLKLSLRPALDTLSVYDGHTVNDTLLGVFNRIGSAMLPFVVSTNNTNSMLVVLETTGTVTGDWTNGGFIADFRYQCMAAPAVCQQQVTDTGEHVSQGAKAAFVFFTVVVMLLMVACGFIKSYRSPNSSK
eukprot:TRINITY_DN4115_c1_g2_i1.p1 TRINITY_DN4115_c1_g2~~TRINITY_DN4115_c1_g2_i1.p1  ORF type:complete len:204 (+),score=42.72 TRINITY_DN4115_c1_g2_i1:85-696(+)